MKSVKFKFVSVYNRKRQVFEGTCNGVYFSARFGEHLLVINFKGTHTFLSTMTWEESESTRKSIVEEFLEWN